MGLSDDFDDGLSTFGAEAERAQPLTWVIDDILPEGGVVLFAGEPKRGRKTVIATYLALCIGTGRPFLDHFPVQRRPTLYTVIEDGEPRTRRRLKALGAHDLQEMDRAFVNVNYRIAGYQRGLALLESYKTKPDAAPVLWVIDPLAEVLASMGIDENDMAEVTNFLRPLRELAQVSKSVVLINHHFRKAGDVMRGSTALNAASDGWITSTWMSKKVTKLAWTLRDPSPNDVYEAYVTFTTAGANGQVRLVLTYSADAPDGAETARVEHEIEVVRRVLYQYAREAPTSEKTIGTAIREAGTRISNDRVGQLIRQLADRTGSEGAEAVHAGGRGWRAGPGLVALMRRRGEAT